MSALENDMELLELQLSQQFGDEESFGEGSELVAKQLLQKCFVEQDIKDSSCAISEEEDLNEEELFDDLFCVACNRLFKTEKACVKLTNLPWHYHFALCSRAHFQLTLTLQCAVELTSNWPHANDVEHRVQISSNCPECGCA